MTDSLASSFDRLPDQLLVQVLQRVQPAQRLGSCALVCRAWRTAAAMATTEINKTDATQSWCDSLSAWLTSHPAPADIRAISITGAVQEQQAPLLVLPSAQQLHGLQMLKLNNLNWEARAAEVGGLQEGSAAGPAQTTAVLPALAELTAQTSLDVSSYSGALAGVEALTGLKTLCCHAMEHHRPPSCLAGSVAALTAALPRLQALSCLYLRGMLCQEATMAAIPHLTQLKDFVLTPDSSVASLSCTALPSTLTLLALDMRDYVLPITPSSPPGISMLTDLQVLVVMRSIAFDMRVVSAMTQLQELLLEDTRRVTTPGVPELLVLSMLTCLQHLELYGDEHEAYAPHGESLTTAAAAALTASPALKHLSLHEDAALLSSDHCAAMFPPGRKLLQLAQANLSISLLTSPPCTNNFVQCCPNLRRLCLVDAQDAILDTLHVSLRSLAALSSLEQFDMQAPDATFRPEEWSAVAALTGLTRLGLDLGEAEVPDLLVLSSCRRLSELEVVVETDAWLASFSLCLKSQAPEDSAPDVWAQLPLALLEQVHQYMKEVLEDRVSQDDHQALAALLQDALTVSSHIQQQQQQQDLQHRLAAAEEQVSAMQQQLADAHAHVAALQQQLLATHTT